jgi:hypothetical protein
MLFLAFAAVRMRPEAGHFLLGSVVGLSIVSLILLTRTEHDTWPEIAVRIGHAPSHPVFFERGFVVTTAGRAHEDDSNAFPQGYYRAVFDYYYKDAIHRITIDPQRPDEAREQIAAAAKSNHGAWLISCKPVADALSELPQGPDWRLEHYVYENRVTVWDIEPK